MGDNIFSLYGHGNYDHITDSKGSLQQKPTNAADFDKILSGKSRAYAKAIKENTAFELYLYVCFSASGNKYYDSMAEQISKAHPKATIIGFDGYAVYGRKDGKPAIIGSSSTPNANDNKGKVLYFKNGEVIKTLTSKEFINQMK